ncbi:gp16 family protein [Rhizobium laguerreae]|uniref:gp16 family protein n=1 Tax=Rhizobium laguerreae TaxID=1076926 RepID=UPI001C91015E|nr:regulatory protein GemA [Rhizobium laguerreae]MBY3342707.1 regulatory protein GemA [Rhizobium laguerreae]MBY3349742.1 regulatory protein GemA [Rhizobium laguerreae]MBY3370845.1 regulatory protein GemA [Rhizobium laguerreae]MBY3426085.1 regulatory protein GemA [Rhizobium laguerreae]MBY3434364.1 regulatory protein GemA [Rhizobium laguerreae]
MSSSLAAIHVAKKKLGLDDDTYRAKLERITGKLSAKDMTEAERQQVLTVLRSDGFMPAPAARRGDGRQKLTGKYAKKLQALWIAAWNLGIVRDRDDKALVAFVKRQTGIDHTRFLVYADDARRAIEALKGWINREASIPYGNTNGYDWLAADGAKVAWAQWKILMPGAGFLVRKGFDSEVAKLSGRAMLQEVTAADWQIVMNSFGDRIRAGRGRSGDLPVSRGA